MGHTGQPLDPAGDEEAVGNCRDGLMEEEQKGPARQQRNWNPATLCFSP
jgi:hypothetical protein